MFEQSQTFSQIRYKIVGDWNRFQAGEIFKRIRWKGSYQVVVEINRNNIRITWNSAKYKRIVFIANFLSIIFLIVDSLW